jgi:cholesterol oxidase
MPARPHSDRLSAAEHLSSPVEEVPGRYQVIVVGSGYGGAIAACRLSRAGFKVALLERGIERQPGDYPASLEENQPGEYPVSLEEMYKSMQTDLPGWPKRPATGLYDCRLTGDIDVVVGCGLGGTSLINANVSLKPDARVFDDQAWPRELRNDVRGGLARGYKLAREMLEPKPCRKDLAKLAALRESAHATGQGAHFKRPSINVTVKKGHVNSAGVHQHACVLCGNCVSGCNYGAKNTVLMNYLPDACNHKARLFTRAAVRSVQRNGHRWTVHYEALESRGPSGQRTRSVSADKVVLAAGTLGSTEILLRSREKHGLALSSVLGTRFTGNGDLLGFAYKAHKTINGLGVANRNPQPPVNVGPCITGMIDLRDPHEVLEDGLVIEEGALPGGMGGLVQVMLFGQAALRLQASLPPIKMLRDQVERVCKGRLGEAFLEARVADTRNSLIWLVMGHDDGNGTLRLKRDRVHIDWPKHKEQEVFRRAEACIKKLTRPLGARFIPNPTGAIRGHGITVHPLGGCPMGDDAASGVVDHLGRVYAGDSGTATHPGLYVLDGSVIPRPLGVNPLLTICAVVERSCEALVKESGRDTR